MRRSPSSSTRTSGSASCGCAGTTRSRSSSPTSGPSSSVPSAAIFADYLDSRPDAYEAEPEEEFGLDEETQTSEDEDEDDNDDEIEMLDFDGDAEWGGDADIYADRGLPAADLIEQVEQHRSDPARVVAHVGETVGFADQLEAAR